VEPDVVLVSRTAPRRRQRVALRYFAALAVVVLVMLVASQFALPAIATSRLTASLSRTGTDVHVSISAFPAVELLLGDADTVNVSIGRMVSATHHVGDLLARTANVGALTATVRELRTHGLVLTNVSLRKRGARLTAVATVTRAAVQTLLPLHLVVTPTAPGTNGLLVHGAVSVLGHSISVTGEVHAQNGNIVLNPKASGVASLLNAIHFTIFTNPSVSVDTVTAVAHGDAYTLSAMAHY
jgi:hypothetical protein